MLPLGRGCGKPAKLNLETSLGSSRGAVPAGKVGIIANYPLTPKAEFQTDPPFSAQVQQGF